MKIFENLPLKIISILFAFTVWFYVQGKDVMETAVKFNIAFSNIPQGMYVEEVSSPDVAVWIKVPKHMLNSLLKQERKIEINLKDFPKGRSNFSITPDKIKLSDIFDIVKIQPEKITIKLNYFATKTVNIALDYKGGRDYRIEPKSIVIKGERKVLDNIKEVYTEQVREDEAAKELKLKIIPPNENVMLSEDKVKITFR